MVSSVLFIFSFTKRKWLIFNFTLKAYIHQKKILTNRKHYHNAVEEQINKSLSIEISDGAAQQRRDIGTIC